MADQLPHEGFRVQDLGEQVLLQQIQRFCLPTIVGDDAAVLALPPQQSLVVTTDMLVDGVHFSLGQSGAIATMSPADAGWRGAAANLSDLAAMGATPIGITVALGLPPTFPVDWVTALYVGMQDCLTQFDTPILGGDLCRANQLTFSITALGQVHPTQQIQRATAQAGDAILVTGDHGASRAGLALLQDASWGLDLNELERQQLRLAHQRPLPRLDVISHLRDLAPAARVAGMDSSDGLADAVVQICRASQVGAQLWRDRLPMPACLQHTQSLTAAQRLHWTLYGGEDFELVLCLEPALAEPLLAKLGPDAAIIGTIVSGTEVHLIDGSGKPWGEPLTLSQGFQHFASGA